MDSFELDMGQGGFQELDQMPWFQACTKYQVRVNRRERMAELARKCFYIAKAECGPTQLNIPRDYFYGEIDCEASTTTITGLTGNGTPFVGEDNICFLGKTCD